MQIAPQQNQVSMSGNFAQTKYQIEVTALTFDLMINKLYKDKPQSIIRELVSNAWDAHVDAKTTDRAVIVTLPTELEKNLIIKDFGTGLSPEDVTGFYCRICATNREKSNDFLGGYGLGCKSPHSYADQYTVQSRWKGIQYTFSIFKGEDGIPTIALINQTHTDEHNGLTITVPVKRGDINDFAVAAQKVLPWFPNISNNKDINSCNPLWERDGISLYKPTFFMPARLYARVGNVLYEIDGELLDKELIKNREYYWKTAIVIDIPIGVVSIIPSREELAYDTKTKAYLNEAVKQARNILVKEAILIIEDAPTYKEACINSKAFRLTLNSMEWWDKRITKDGQPFSDYILTEVPDAIKVGTIEQNSRGRSYKIGSYSDKKTINAHIEKGLTICYASSKTKHLTERVRKLSPYDIDSNGYLIVTDKRCNELFESCTIGKVCFIDLDNYYIEPKTRIAGTKRETFQVNDLYDNNVWIPDEEFFYLEGKHNCVSFAGQNDNFFSIRNTFALMGYRDILVIPPFKMASIKKLNNAIDFNEEFKRHCERLRKDTHLWISIYAYRKFAWAEYHTDKQLHTTFAKKHPHHPLIELMKLLKEGEKKSCIACLFEDHDEKLPEIAIPDDINKQYEQYKVFLNILPIEDPHMINAYDFYLENYNA